MPHGAPRSVMQLMSQYESRSYKDYLAACSRMVTVCKLEYNSLTLEAIVSYMRMEWDAGRSPSTVIKALTMLDKVCACILPSWTPMIKCYVIRETLTAWEKNWMKKSQTPRKFIDWPQAQALAVAPPKNTDPFLWKSYVLIAWTFLLRHGEVRQIKPNDIHYFKEGDAWEINLGSCKTAKAKGRTQTARMPTHLIPQPVIEILQAFSAFPSENFSWKINKNSVCEHIRKTLLPGDPGYVFHSLRHGRATHLRRSHHIGDEYLKVLGRWASLGGLYCYLHC